MSVRRQIITALSAGSLGRIPALYDVDHATRLVDAHAAEVLAGDREKATPTGATATPDFFQPGHTYADADGKYDWKFRCDTITTHPEDGERTALGWRHFRGVWEPYAYDEGDWDIHQSVGYVDVTEAGGDRG